MSTHRSRPVRCIETGQEFESVNDAANWLGTDARNVSKQLNGHVGATKGHHFEYLPKAETVKPVKPKPCRGRERGNICFECKNAVPSAKRGTGCPWSRSFKPVPGWTAEPVRIDRHNGKGGVDSYNITACPMFERG